MSRILFSFLAIVCLSVAVVAQTTQPGTAPATQPSANDVLDSMLKPAGTSAPPLQPQPDVVQPDRTTGSSTVAPGAQQMNLMREGTFIVDRAGRLTKTADGQQWEFTFDSDGRALADPPIIILPNLKLMTMENAMNGSSRDLHFRITGMVTEYRGRNYVLLDKMVVEADSTQTLDGH